jgi:threonine aldolase
MHRRNFLAASLGSLQIAAAASDDRVIAYGDGVSLSPEEFARLLSTVTAGGKVEPDSYSLGGIVEKLESHMASVLGKETAVWLPTGTLANHLAVRILAGGKRRVLVQEESHLQNDCGDCAETLSGLHLIGLAPGKATFTLEQAERAADDALLGRVATPVGALQIETPVRRLNGERFDFEEMRKICAWARTRKIGLHLDGARLFIESAYTKRPVKEYCSLFDTVYISMYKYFNSGCGAILAGPKALLADLFETRRMFGGGLPHVWPFAAIALHYVDGFEQRLGAAIDNAEQAIKLLAGEGHFSFERVPNGTNVFRMRVSDVNAPVYQVRLEDAGISARAPVATDWFTLQINETWARVPASEIARRFHKALG